MLSEDLTNRLRCRAVAVADLIRYGRIACKHNDQMHPSATSLWTLAPWGGKGSLLSTSLHDSVGIQLGGNCQGCGNGKQADTLLSNSRQKADYCSTLFNENHQTQGFSVGLEWQWQYEKCWYAQSQHTLTLYPNILGYLSVLAPAPFLWWATTLECLVSQ